MGCTGESFHLRGASVMPKSYNAIYLQGIDPSFNFGHILSDALQRSGSRVVPQRENADVVLNISQLRESKRVVGYGTNREVKEYLVYIRFKYSVQSVATGDILLSTSEVNLDKTQAYDSTFVLGKVEEEGLLRERLRENAARQVLLRMRSAVQTKK